MPYTVTVRDQMMIAHSLPRPVFGPAQGLHGATYVIEATFGASEVDADGIVIDIGLASAAVAAVAARLTYHNLDDLPEFTGVVTTTEVLCRWVADAVVDWLAAAGAEGAGGLGGVTSLVVTLRESPSAWASYSRTVGAEAAS